MKTQLPLAACLSLLLLLASCTRPEKQPAAPPAEAPRDHLADLRKHFEESGVNLPQQYYESAAALAHRRARPYDGNYVPACLDANSEVVRFDGLQAPVVPDGQLLSVVSGDPAIKDRSLAALTAHWSHYFQEDFRYHCKLDGMEEPQMCSPVTFYKDYKKFLEAKDMPNKVAAPQYVSTFIFVPSHFTIAAPGNEQFGIKDIFDLFERVRNIQDIEKRLVELHKLCSWLKEDRRVTRIADRDVPPLVNHHFTGSGKLWLPGMAFGPPSDADTVIGGRRVREPRVAFAVPDILRRLTLVHADYSAAYTAEFSYAEPQTEEAYYDFIFSSPWASLYEEIAYTDDPLAVEAATKTEQQSHVSLMLNGTSTSARPAGHIHRGVLYAAGFPPEYRIDGIATLDGQTDRPPSGICMEEAAFMLHPSMFHTLDGWGLPGWSSNPEYFMLSLFRNFPAVGKQWNDNWASQQDTYNQKVLVPLQPPLVHMEFWDSHIYIPHGDISLVQARLQELKSGAQTKAEWEALGYTVPDGWPCTKEKPCQLAKCDGTKPCQNNPCLKDPVTKQDPAVNCTQDNLMIRKVTDCNDNLACINAIAAVFKAPYAGPFTRTATSLAPDHNDEGKVVVKMFADPTAESVVDNIKCHASIDSPFIKDKACIWNESDETKPPLSGYGKSTVIGEPVGFLFNYLWTYGSMYPVHDMESNHHLPRYWSMDGETGGQMAGLISFRNWRPDCISFPPPDSGTIKYRANWFVLDSYNYFGSVKEVYQPGTHEVDLSKINRTGRGDGLYLLQYYPQRFLFWKSDGGVYDESYGSNLPNPSYPSTGNKCAP